MPRTLAWLGRKSIPRSASEALTLALMCLGIVTLLVELGSAASKRHTPGPEVAWCSVLFAGALVARTWRFWRGELETLTRERVRTYAGCLLLVLVAVSASWHFLSESVGWAPAYLFLGPLSGSAVGPAALACVVVAAVAILLKLPVGDWLRAAWRSVARAMSTSKQRRVVRSDYVDELAFAEDLDRGVEQAEEPVDEDVPALIPRVRASRSAPLATSVPPESSPVLGPRLPPIETFKPAPRTLSAPVDLEHKAQRIEETLASFNVRARVVGHHAGPVVTQFDIQPEAGVKVKSIVALQNDLALALSAPTIRIQAPVPGKPVVGVEIPNSAASVVSLRELLECEAYRAMRSPLATVLGKDVAGAPSVIDLGKMPHLLVAGSTGSGKSVCINAMISCLLYRNTPEQVRLLMVDPKMVELTVYDGVPHLLSPVVTEMDKVVGVLQWALREMERRYQQFKQTGVRNISRYNEKMEQAGLKAMPYIVLIIDELADLMMVSPEDVEEAICRLAQLARAAGIHLVIATQRPSVDVVTGLIKANFPARIAFMMTSQVDSRTILDRAGAEKLLGRGDMLYQPPDGPAPVRLQGAHVSDQEIERLVEFWKGSPMSAVVQPVPAEEFAAAEKAAENADDELLQEATQVVKKFRTASVTLLQRHLRIGYARAARVMDQLEERGIVGPQDGSKQRAVLVHEEGREE